MRLTSSRRAFLRRIGLATAASALPFRRGVLQAQGDAAIPKRFVGLKYCNGIQRDLWFPKGEGDEFALPETLPRLLEPFAAFREKLIVPVNLGLAASRQAGGSHDAGMFTFLSGRDMQLGGGLTIDQHIADAVGKVTPIPSLQTGTKAFRSASHGAISFRGPHQPMRPLLDPYVAYDQIFGEIAEAGTPEALAALRAERRSVLDEVAKDLHDLANALGGADRARLEFHLESVRQVEQHLSAETRDCTPPAVGEIIDITDDANVPTVSRLHMEILAAAFTCRLTHVATHSWGAAAQSYKFPWLGIPMIMHGLSHWNEDPATRKPQHEAALRWHFEEMAYLMQLLDAAKEEDGRSILDHSLLLVGTDNGQSPAHEIHHIPFLLAGGLGGALRTGRCVVYPDRTAHNDLLIAIAHLFGAPVETFGNPDYCTGPLGGLT